MNPQTKEKIESMIKSKPIAIFMKGVLGNPMCGFSAKACELLLEAGAPADQIASFNVLADESIRSGVKEFTNWPTLPQVFIQGEFVGGCDIVTEMFEKGELQQVLKSAGIAN